MKKWLTLITLTMGLSLALGACSTPETEGPLSTSPDATSISPQPTSTPTPLDLTGDWKQTNSGADDSWQEATISGDTIEIFWIIDNGDTTALYWSGSFTAPTQPVDKYFWTSNNDHSKTDDAMLASSDNTKDFTYDNGVISYKVSAFDVTKTFRLERL